MRAVIRYLRIHALAFVALFVALGGTTYAATGFPANVIGTKQLKKSAVTAPKIRNGAVTGSKAADNSLTGADMSESTFAKVPEAATASAASNASDATNATNASNASTAATATNADDAEQLGGVPALGIQRRGSVPFCLDDEAIYFVGPQGPVGCRAAGVIPFSAVLSSPSGQENNLLEGAPFDLDLDITGDCNFPVPPGSWIGFYSSDPATINWFFSTDNTTHYASGDVMPGGNVIKNFGFDNKRLEGQFIFAQDNVVATVKVHAFDGGTFCEVYGTVVYAKSG